MLQEYFVAATHKLRIAPLTAKDLINAIRNAFETILVSPEIINRAVDGSILWQVSFWDALILASAEDSVLFCRLRTDQENRWFYRKNHFTHEIARGEGAVQALFMGRKLDHTI